MHTLLEIYTLLVIFVLQQSKLSNTVTAVKLQLANR